MVSCRRIQHASWPAALRNGLQPILAPAWLGHVAAKLLEGAVLDHSHPLPRDAQFAPEFRDGSIAVALEVEPALQHPTLARLQARQRIAKLARRAFGLQRGRRS